MGPKNLFNLNLWLCFSCFLSSMALGNDSKEINAKESQSKASIGSGVASDDGVLGSFISKTRDEILKKDSQKLSVKSKFPQVLSIVGVANWSSELKDKRKLTLQTSLEGSASIYTGPQSQVVIALSPSKKIYILEESEVYIPVLDRSQLKIPRIDFKKGRFYWMHRESSEEPTVVTTELYSLTLPVRGNGSYGFVLDEARAEARVLSFKGALTFKEFYSETVQEIIEGYEGGFRGVRESGEWVFDVLLKGRKIPQGKKIPLEKIKSEDFLKFQIAQELQSRKEKLRVQHIETERVQREKSGVICKEPLGAFNQCSWICEGERGSNGGAKSAACPVDEKDVFCVRYRCSLDGRWKERQVLASEEGRIACRSQQKGDMFQAKILGRLQKARVSNCDY